MALLNIFFSTNNKNIGYINGRLSNTKIIFSSTAPHYLESDVTNHQLIQKELLLFVRIDQETGFYYFGRCNYSREHNLPNYPFLLYCLELLDTRISDLNVIEISELSN